MNTAAEMPAGVGGDLATRADALESAAELAKGRLDADDVERALTAVAKVRARLRHGSDRTVVALAGPTGAGKSSLFNAVVGAEVSTPGVRRPTTSAPHAALWGGDEPRLLRWLEIPRRYLVEADASRPDAGELDGLVLIDLPDVDSIEVSNRLESERLIDVVDAMVWVLDPQKYADDVVHAQIATLAGAHADVLRFALTKIDLVAEPERPAVIADLEQRLRADGVAAPIVWAVDTRQADHGLVALRAGLASVVTEQRALVSRLSGDLRHAASALIDDNGAGAARDVDPQAIRDAAIDEVAAAARVGDLATAVDMQYQRQARRATGWLPRELVRGRRPSPVLGVVKADSIDQLRVESALRAAAEVGAADAGAPWDKIVRREVMARSDDVVDALRSRSVNVARIVGQPPRWWGVFRGLQRVLLAAAIVGVMWLLAVAAAGGLGLATDPLIIKVGPTPVPSALVIGGIGLGIIFALIARIPASIGGRRRGRAVRTEMREQTRAVLDQEVVGPVQHVLADRAEIFEQLAIARGA